MSDTRWRLIEELFAEAVELPPGEHDAFLARTCADDASLRRELEALLQSHPLAANAVRGVVVDAAVASRAPQPSALIGTMLGPYRITALIGEGGMGTVFRGERDDREFRRVVAVKVLRRGSASPAEVARLRDERQILASLDHPGIVRLFDGGTTDAGVPYLVMEHVEGAPLTEYARDKPVRERVALLHQVCAAVQHAHQHLVVHRDLKPSNILVDRDGVPKLLDFGIAKLLDPDGREARTRTGAALLTLEYASPEQARGESVSVATDVYALGAVLYELLTGKPPHRVGDDMLATLREICEVDVQRPSAVTAAELRRELVGDLDNIVLRAMQKSPAARYPSVAAFADDLERYSTGQPVTARAATFGYRSSKFVRRHRGALALAFVGVSALASAAVVSYVQARRATSQTHLAEQRTRSLLVVQALRELSTGRVSRALPYLAHVLKDGDDTPTIRFLLAEALRPLELQIGEPFVLAAGIHGAAWSPDGKTIAVSSWRGDLLLLDAELHVRKRLDAGTELVTYPTFTPDGSRLIATSGPGNVMVFDTHTGARLHRWDDLRVKVLTRPTHPEVAHLQVDDDRVAVVNTEGHVGVWDLADGRAVFRLDVATGEARATAAVVTADGKSVFVGRSDGTIVRWDIGTHAPVAALPVENSAIFQLRLASGNRLFSTMASGMVRLWDASTGAPIATLDGHADPMYLALDRTESLLATFGFDDTVRLWDAHTGKAKATLHHAGGLFTRAVAFSPDGKRVVSTGGDHTFRVWNTTTGESELLLESFAAAGDTPHSVGGALDARFAPEEPVLLTASGTDLRRWRVTDAPLVAEYQTGIHMYSAKLSPDEKLFAAVGRKDAAIFDAATGVRLRTLKVPPVRLLDVEWTHDASHVIVCGDDGTALVFAAADGTQVAVLPGFKRHVNGSVVSPDGRTFVTASDDGTAQIWDANTWKLVRTFQHPDRVLSATWSRDGTRLVTAGWDRTLRIWDPATGRLLRTFSEGATQYLYASLSPDGHVLASAGHDGELSLWSVESGKRIRSLEGHTGPVTQVEWSPDGTFLASSGDDETSRVWDPDTGMELVVRHQPESILQLWWTGDGMRILSVSYAGSVRVWAVERDLRPPRQILALATSLSPWRLVDGQLVRER